VTDSEGPCVIDLSEDERGSRLLHHPVMQMKIRLEGNERMTPTLEATVWAQLFQTAEAWAVVNVQEWAGQVS
jgi:hypothetical protein